MDIRGVAANGLARADRCLLRGNAIAVAEGALRDVFDASAADEGVQAFARMGLAASGALQSKAARLEVLKLALSRVQGDALGSVSGMCRFGYDVLEAIDRHKIEKAPRADAMRAVVAAIADQAGARSLREAEYARYIADLAEVVPPVYALNMLTRVDVAEVGDVTRPAWFAAVAHSFATGGDFEEGENGVARVLSVVDPWVTRRAAEDASGVLPAHLSRERSYADKLGLSPAGRRALHLATLRVAGDDVPCVPETALVLAYQARQNRMPREETAAMIDAALDEACQGTYPAGNEAGAMVKFMDAARRLPGGGELVNRALLELVDGRGIWLDRLKWGVNDVLARGEPVDGLCDAFRALDGHGSSERDDVRTARLGLKMAEWAKESGRSRDVLQNAFDRVASMGGEARDRKLVLDVARATLSDPAADREATLRETLDRLTRMGTDRQQDFIIGAAAPREPAGTVRTEEDYVIIGTVRVPRRALSK